MLTRSEAEAVLGRALALSPAAQTELILTERAGALTRFARNAITQNVEQASLSLSIRVLEGKREGKVDLNQLDERSIRRAYESAMQVLRCAPANPELLPLEAGPQSYRSVDAFAEATARATPEERADAAARAIERCRCAGAQAAGIFSTDAQGTGFATSTGTFAFHAQTDAVFSVTATAPDGAQEAEGWSEAREIDCNRLDVDKVASGALDRALRGRGAEPVPPGRYTVVLEPAAVQELALFFSWLACGALRYQEGRAYNSGRLGEKFFGENFSMADDAFHPMAPQMPFDYEGVPRQRVQLVERGVAKGLVHDRRTAAKAGCKSTGHGLPQPNTDGPLAGAIVVEGGTTSLDEMVRSTDRGLLVTKFHYCNVVNPMDLSITGMTRAGVFLIEGGRVARPVKNLRFTQSLVDAFSRIEALGPAERTEGALFGGSFICPPMKISGFNFSSGTDF